MNRFAKVFRKRLFNVSLQTALNEAADQIAALFPVLASVAIDIFVDGKASVELEIEDGFRLFGGQGKLFRQGSDVFVFALLCDLFNHMGGYEIMREFHEQDADDED